MQTVKISCRIDTEKLNRLKELYQTDSVTQVIDALIDLRLSDGEKLSDKPIDSKKLSDTINRYMREYKREWSERNREHLRAYYKEYRRKNPEKFRGYNRNYWERKASLDEGNRLNKMKPLDKFEVWTKKSIEGKAGLDT